MDWVVVSKVVYDLSLAITLAIVLWRGERDEKIGIAVIVVASAATALNTYVSVRTGWRSRFGLLVIDLGTLIAFDSIMRSSIKFWPIWATGVQLAAVSLDADKIITNSRHSHLYVQGKYAYLIFLVIILSCMNRRR